MILNCCVLVITIVLLIIVIAEALSKAPLVFFVCFFFASLSSPSQAHVGVPHCY